MPTPFRPKRINRPDALVPAPVTATELSADGAVPIDEDGWFNITKAGAAAALTVAAPGAKNIGRRLTFYTLTDFAHVLTFTGSTLRDGTTGASITYTATAFQGCALCVVAVNATTWNVESMNLGAIA